MNIETLSVHGFSGGDKITGAISFPIYQSATFKHLGLGKSTGYDYSRDTNPTREEVEKTIATLENGVGAIGCSSGVAAIVCCIHLFKSGDHIILSEDLYGGTFRLFHEAFKEFGISSSFVDTTKLSNIETALTSNTKAIFIETPSNPTMRVSDIREISRFTKENNLLLIVDNTFLTPYYQKPLTLGADLVVHSGTKYLSGHHDLLSGFVVTSNKDLYHKIKRIHMTLGATLSPFDSWLLLRSLKTLHVRLDKSEENAIEIAKFLSNHPKVSEVLYVGLEDFHGYEINKKQSSGYGSTLSFKVKAKNIIPKLLKSVKIIRFAESLGGVETLITYPFTQTHTDIPEEMRKKLGIDEHLLRLSVGIENVNDLIEDLNNALN